MESFIIVGVAKICTILWDTELGRVVPESVTPWYVQLIQTKKYQLTSFHIYLQKLRHIAEASRHEGCSNERAKGVEGSFLRRTRFILKLQTLASGQKQCSETVYKACLCAWLR